MKIAVIGSRTFNDYNMLEKTLLILFRHDSETFNNTDIIVSGGAQGADKLSEQYADKWKLKKEIYLADWKRHGASAGFIRNKTIVESADVVVAFWDGTSKGTEHSISYARKLFKDTHIFYFKEKQEENINLEDYI